MKLLLTSNGLSNNSIAKAFQELIGKDPKDSKVAFIPTAANGERGNKDWLIDDMHRIKEQGYYVDMVELTAISLEELRKTLQAMDAIFVGGGSTFYLSYWMQKSGLFDILPELLKTKVYAGISAGSMITGESLRLSSDVKNYNEVIEHYGPLADDDYDLTGPPGQSSSKTLKFVPFLFRPHLNSDYFPRVRKDFLEKAATKISAPIYAIDDESALKIVDGSVEVISEGEWLLFNDKSGNT